MDNEPSAKVLFRVPHEDDDGADVETLWAFDLGNDRYKLDNLPYFAYGVSCDDVVLAPFDEDEGFPTFQKVVTKSGNRTVRIFFEEKFANSSKSSALLDRLVERGCTFENGNGRLVAVEVPENVDLNGIAEELIRADVYWEYADPTYEELFPDAETVD